MNSTNKTALVTGSSSGIGFEVAKGFLEGGWNVVINGRDPADLASAAKKLGFQSALAVVAGSTSDAKTGEAMVRAATERFGAVDLLVNNAGESGFKASLKVTSKDLEHYWSANLKGTYLTTQAVVRAMTDTGRGGSIVNIGTVLVDPGATWVTASASLVSKGGVRALTVALAAELAPCGIRVNAIAPGFIRTPLTESADAATPSGAAPAGRIGDVAGIYEAVRYLADSTFVTGHVLDVDGGFVSARR